MYFYHLLLNHKYTYIMFETIVNPTCFHFLLLQVYSKRYLCDVGSHNKHYDILYVRHVTAL